MISRSALSWQNRLSSVALRRIVGAIGLIAALAVSLAGPVSFAIAAYLELAEVLAFKAQLNASKISKFVYAHEKLWQYQHVRLTEIIELPHTDPDEPIRQRVTDTAGRVVLEEGPPLAGPLLRRQAPIVVRGNVVGAIELESSLTPFLGSLALIGLVSLAVGVGAYIAFSVLPLRLLDRTLGQARGSEPAFRPGRQQHVGRPVLVRCGSPIGGEQRALRPHVRHAARGYQTRNAARGDPREARQHWTLRRTGSEELCSGSFRAHDRRHPGKRGPGDERRSYDRREVPTSPRQRLGIDPRGRHRTAARSRTHRPHGAP